jgi:ferritin-like metal-binding protein YciE
VQRKEFSKRQVERLTEIFKTLDKPPMGEKCDGVLSIFEEDQELMQNNQRRHLLNDILIATQPKIEFHEMASYGTTRSFALKLGRDEDAVLLQASLFEVGRADRMLTDVANRIVSPQV